MGRKKPFALQPKMVTHRAKNLEWSIPCGNKTKTKEIPIFQWSTKQVEEKNNKKKKAFAHVQYLHSLVRNLCTGPTKVSKSIKIAVKIHTHKSTPYKKARELSHRLARFGMWQGQQARYEIIEGTPRRARYRYVYIYIYMYIYTGAAAKTHARHLCTSFNHLPEQHSLVT